MMAVFDHGAGSGISPPLREPPANDRLAAEPWRDSALRALKDKGPDICERASEARLPDQGDFSVNEQRRPPVGSAPCRIHRWGRAVEPAKAPPAHRALRKRAAG